MGWMITVVERPDVVTRLLVGCEPTARKMFSALRDRKVDNGWLTVSISQQQQDPVRSTEEKQRAVALVLTATKEQQ